LEFSAEAKVDALEDVFVEQFDRYEAELDLGCALLAAKLDGLKLE